MMNCILFIVFFLFSYNNNSRKMEQKEYGNGEKNYIVLIFDKNEKIDFKNEKTIISSNSDIKYSEKGSYIEKEIYPDNKNRKDTIKLNINSESILLSHIYNKKDILLFEFQKGDTVVFNYVKDCPQVELKNRKALQYDFKIEAIINKSKPLEGYQFYQKNNHFRTENEEKLYLEELKKYTLDKSLALDSLYHNNLLSKKIHELHKNRIKFYEFNINRNVLKPNEISKEDLQRDDLLYLKTYRTFLGNYAVKKYKYKLLSDKDPFSYDSRIAFDVVANDKMSDFSEEARGCLLYTYLKNIAEMYSNKELNSYFNKFKEKVKHVDIIDKINNDYLLDFSSIKEETKEVYFLELSKQKTTLDEMISKNKGKVIYVDFWASWCAPCRAMMPASRKLQEEYKNKDAVFIYVSIDDDFEKWKKASEKEGILFDKNNLLAVNYPDASFYKNLQLKSIPRYLVYNKKGKLVHQKSPSPNTDEIRKELNKYLAE